MATEAGSPGSPARSASSVTTRWRGISTMAAVPPYGEAFKVSAAAAIMVVVFLSFVLTPDVSVKQIGLGLAAAVLVDATVVRLVLVPAVMELLGRANWWLPSWLARLLPAGPGGHRQRERARGLSGRSPLTGEPAASRPVWFEAAAVRGLNRRERHGGRC